MTVTKGLVTVLASTAVATTIGGLGGHYLGVHQPEFYRAVLQGGDRPGFDPVAVGVGLGVTQGAVAGMVVGLAVVAIVTWYELRRAAWVEGSCA